MSSEQQQESKALTSDAPAQPPPYSTMPHDGHKVLQPDQPGYPESNVTIMAPVVLPQAVTYLVGFGPHPRQMLCTACNQEILTQTKPVIGLLTWLISGALVFVGCWFGCCLIPCCVPECQDIEHWCPNCNRHLGTYKRL